MWRTAALKVLAFACAVTLCEAEISSSPNPSGSLRITSAAEGGYNDVIVKRVNDTLSLSCGDGHDAPVVWSLPQPHYSVRVNKSAWPPAARVSGSRLEIAALQLEDTGLYICASPPLSISKYIVVQPPAPPGCARGGFSCGLHCVLPMYVCDGRADCAGGEDESEQTCGTTRPCDGKLVCGEGRCISEAWCWDTSPAEGMRPACCELYAEPQPDVGLDSLAPGRRADYGFIQSTIYTVTACALIFMIAVVLLVSAICKMHMKRAALRSYARAERARQHYGPPLCQFPPCYEASRPLTEPAPPADACAPPDSPQRQATGAGATEESCGGVSAEEPPARPTNFGFGRLTDAIFNSRYRRVPTQCCDVEMTSVATDAPLSPARDRSVCLGNYTSPTFCDINGGDYYFANADTGCYGRDLNYASTPLDFYMSESDRQRALRRATAVERILDRISFNTSYRVDNMEQNYGHSSEDRSLTLQLGRFQLSLPRFTRSRRGSGGGRRPDTPNVAELNIDELDFVRLNSNETYTLNGRTIHLLGANFENYPNILSVGNAASFVGRVVAPPPYSEVVAVAPSKIFGPPPAYLSRENLTNATETDANANVEASGNNRMSIASTSTDVGEADCNGNTEGGTGGGAEPPPSYEELPGAQHICDSLDSNANNTQ